MKLILFIDCLGAGGAQRQFVGLAIMLKERGYNVKVSTYYDIDFYKKQLDDAGVPNELIPEANDTKKRIIAVRKYFKKEHPDWVIAYQETPSLVACATKVLGCEFKLIVSERNTTQGVGMNEHVRFFLYRWADWIVPNSYSQERFLKHKYPWMEKKLQTITNFVDLEHFSFVERTRRDIPEIVVVATIWESKNTLGFIEAVKILLLKGLKFHVSWYGKSIQDIDYFNKCYNKIKDYKIDDFIELKEKTPQIKSVYHNADFFCLPSYYEGTPNVICEAISTGLPVACSNVCDNSIYVHEGMNGFLFNPYNTHSIVLALEKLFNIDKNFYDKMSRESRRIADVTLSKEFFFNKYDKLLQL